MEAKATFLIDDKGNVIGSSDYSRFNKLKWYQKLYGSIYKPYKNRFVDLKPFKIK